MRIDIRVEGMKELEKELKKLSEEKIAEVKREVYASALDIQMQAKDNLSALDAWDTGNLSGTITVERKDGDLAAEIGPEAPYGQYVELGTRPHFPPPDALEAWARHHGFKSAWPICKVIAKRGLRARPFLAPAFLSLVNEFYERLKRIFEK